MTRFLDNASIFSCNQSVYIVRSAHQTCNAEKTSQNRSESLEIHASLTTISFVTYHIYSQGPEKNTILKTGVFVGQVNPDCRQGGHRGYFLRVDDSGEW